MNAAVIAPAELERIFVDSGALLNGHFALSSGLHSGQYFQCALLLSEPALAERLGLSLAESVPADWPVPDAVVGPALGGVVIGHEVARALRVRSFFTERKDGRMELRRGFSVRPKEKIIVVEDVITTGKSSGEVIRLLRDRGAEIIGLMSIVLRAETDPDLGIPIKSLARLPATGFEPAACPLCAEGIPVVKPGSRPAGTS
ncbi:MAG: orotate phosphoribosyltransferase [Elusimicrobia bacterium CG1_02_63_36]|nr:MAG: orotate phosphoribosyltransferase [Elusimicrobia bacterium CG1_02_63_36]